MTEAVIWLIAGVALLGAEILTGTFVLLMFGGGALAASASAALGGPLLLNSGVFAAVSVLLLAAARPALYRRTEPALESAGNSPVGSSGVVVVRVAGDSGQIKINGELWSARALDRAEEFEPGEHVTVMHLSGVTAMVGRHL